MNWKDIVKASQGLIYQGVVTDVPGANQFTIPELADMGAGRFVDAMSPYYAFVSRDSGGAGAGPQGESQQITAYVNATGTFTTNAFTAAVAVGDEILIMHRYIRFIYNLYALQVSLEGNTSLADKLTLERAINLTLGLSYYGTVTNVPGANQFTIPTLAGQGAGKFNGATNPYYAFVIRDAGGGGAAPQGEVMDITVYDNATGTFTTGAYTVPVAVGDEILILHNYLWQIRELRAVRVGYEGGTPLANKLTAARAALLDNLANLALTSIGRMQIAPTTIDLNQVAGTYDLFTATAQNVIVEGLVIRMSGGAIGGALTSISIQTDDNTPQVFISAAEGAVANLTNQAQLSWAPAGGIILLVVGKKIRLTIAGGAAGVARVCDVVAKCRAVVAGGYLA